MNRVDSVLTRAATPMTILLKVLMMLAGVVTMVLGVIITPLPGPFGVPVIILGLVILLRSSTWMKRQFVKQVKKHPHSLGKVRALLRPGAKILALVWLNMLRCERRLLSRRQRILYRFRNWLRGLLGHRRHNTDALAQA